MNAWEDSMLDMMSLSSRCGVDWVLAGRDVEEEKRPEEMRSFSTESCETVLRKSSVSEAGSW